MRKFGPYLALWLRSGVLVAIVTFGQQADAQRRAPPPPASRSGPPAGDVQSSTAPNGKTGTAALDRARAAWDKADYDVAEPLFEEAIDTGGLAPAEILDAYVRLGSACAVLGKKAASLSAFKNAALIDPHFILPAEAGKKASVIADRARKTEARMGAIALSANIPGDLSPGESAQVDATLDATHAAIISKIALVARDPLTGKSYADSVDPATSVHFKIPSSLTLPSATLVVRVDALDGHQNRLASVENRSRVRPAEGALVAAGGLAGLVAGASDKSGDTSDKDHKKGFWGTAWPYVIGGVALAAGGAAVFVATRQSSDVNVGAVRVDLTR